MSDKFDRSPSTSPDNFNSFPPGHKHRIQIGKVYGTADAILLCERLFKQTGPLPVRTASELEYIPISLSIDSIRLGQNPRYSHEYRGFFLLLNYYDLVS